MNVIRLMRKVRQHIIRRLQPLRFAKLSGVNFGDGLHIYGNISWGTEPWIITLGENVHLTDGIRFITHDGGTLLFRSQVPDLEITKPITLGSNVYVGNDVKFMPGVHVGSWVIIGAGAVVTHDIPDNSVAVGVPARVIKTADAYFEKIQKESLHLGHLKGQEKDKELMKLYGYKGSSKGYYF